jgi:alkyl hydroperoxide reductase subunit AhpF
MKQSKINRRRFLNNSITIGAFSLFSRKLVDQNFEPLSTQTKDVYKEPEKELTIYGRFDVIVVGGGPAGFAAVSYKAGI